MSRITGLLADVLVAPPHADSTHLWTLPFILILIALTLQRLLELRIAQRNQDALVKRGGRVVEHDGYGLIVIVHGVFFAGLAAEWLLAPWARVHAFTVPLLLAFGAAQALRYWVIRTLGVHWTTKVVVVPGVRLVASGPFRWVRHPNYLAVSVELLALPLAFGLPVTALVIGLANAVALTRRIRLEEAALAEASREPATRPARERRGAAG